MKNTNLNSLLETVDFFLAREISSLASDPENKNLLATNLKFLAEAKALRLFTAYFDSLPQGEKLAEMKRLRELRKKYSSCLLAAAFCRVDQEKGVFEYLTGHIEEIFSDLKGASQAGDLIDRARDLKRARKALMETFWIVVGGRP